MDKEGEKDLVAWCQGRYCLNVRDGQTYHPNLLRPNWLKEGELALKEIGFHPEPATLEKVALSQAIEVDPVRRYLDELVAKSRPRNPISLREVAVLITGRESEIDEVVLSRWLVGTVARVYKPGTPVGGLLSLVGPTAHSWLWLGLGGVNYRTISAPEYPPIDGWITEVSGPNPAGYLTHLAQAREYPDRVKSRLSRTGLVMVREALNRNDPAASVIWPLPVRPGYRLPCLDIGYHKASIWALATSLYIAGFSPILTPAELSLAYDLIPSP